MMDRYEAIVVGAGIIGVSIALKLVENNMKTLLIDKCGDSCGATKYSGGVFTRILDDEEEYRWALKSHRFYMRYLNRADFINWGYLIIEETSLVEDDYEEYKRDVNGLRIVYPDEIPNILGIEVRLDDEMGLLVERDFTVNPGQLLEFLREVYMDMGGEFQRANYKGYSKECKTVKLDIGELSYEKLFLCLGPWGEDMPGRYSLSRLISIPIYKFDVRINVGYWDETLYGYFRVDRDSMVGGFYDAYPISDVDQGFGVPYDDSVSYALERINLRLGYKPNIDDMWRAPVALSLNFKPFHKQVAKDVHVFNGFGGRGLILGPGYIEDCLDNVLE